METKKNKSDYFKKAIKITHKQNSIRINLSSK